MSDLSESGEAFDCYSDYLDMGDAAEYYSSLEREPGRGRGRSRRQQRAMSQTRPHAIEDRWSISGFQPRRFIKCRCGWKAEHYNAGYLTELYRQHKAETELSPEISSEEEK